MPRHEPRHQRPKGLLAVLTALILFGLISLGLSVFNAFAISAESDARERERIAADEAACEERNRLRTELVTIAEAQQEMINGILIRFAEQGVHLPDLEPEFEQYRRTVATIRHVDCDVDDQEEP